ncbi:hypothetical protein BB561_002831 [Smittium simulii]|uniref:Uncharacterized protein n=1 Tax=Smittium simulii TaxID=133385 RepID=A0A2T9YNV5_9FUNG|nr:hypothetical protein BB561_002831 [Smittium simulii]
MHPGETQSNDSNDSDTFQPVWELSCKHCMIHWSSRGMEAIVMARPAIRCFSTDLPPLNCEVVFPYATESNSYLLGDHDHDTSKSLSNQSRRFDAVPGGPCDCHVQDLACLGCGNIVGYYIHRPCFRCLAQRYRIKQRGYQHLWTFYQNNVIPQIRINKKHEHVGWDDLFREQEMRQKMQMLALAQYTNNLQHNTHNPRNSVSVMQQNGFNLPEIEENSEPQEIISTQNENNYQGDRFSVRPNTRVRFPYTAGQINARSASTSNLSARNVNTVTTSANETYRANMFQTSRQDQSLIQNSNTRQLQTGIQTLSQNRDIQRNIGVESNQTLLFSGISNLNTSSSQSLQFPPLPPLPRFDTARTSTDRSNSALFSNIFRANGQRSVSSTGFETTRRVNTGHTSDEEAREDYMSAAYPFSTREITENEIFGISSSNEQQPRSTETRENTEESRSLTPSPIAETLIRTDMLINTDNSQSRNIRTPRSRLLQQIEDVNSNNLEYTGSDLQQQESNVELEPTLSESQLLTPRAIANISQSTPTIPPPSTSQRAQRRWLEISEYDMTEYPDLAWRPNLEDISVPELRESTRLQETVSGSSTSTVNQETNTEPPASNIPQPGDIRRRNAISAGTTSTTSEEAIQSRLNHSAPNISQISERRIRPLGSRITNGFSGSLGRRRARGYNFVSLGEDQTPISTEPGNRGLFRFNFGNTTENISSTRNETQQTIDPQTLDIPPLNSSNLDNRISVSNENNNIITSSSENSTGISPSNENSTGISPSNENSTGISPSNENSTGISVSNENSTGISSSNENSTGISVSNENNTGISINNTPNDTELAYQRRVSEAPEELQNLINSSSITSSILEPTSQFNQESEQLERQFSAATVVQTTQPVESAYRILSVQNLAHVRNIGAPESISNWLLQTGYDCMSNWEDSIIIR